MTAWLTVKHMHVAAWEKHSRLGRHHGFTLPTGSREKAWQPVHWYTIERLLAEYLTCATPSSQIRPSMSWIYVLEFRNENDIRAPMYIGLCLHRIPLRDWFHSMVMARCQHTSLATHKLANTQAGVCAESGGAWATCTCCGEVLTRTNKRT